MCERLGLVGWLVWLIISMYVCERKRDISSHDFLLFFLERGGEGKRGWE